MMAEQSNKFSLLDKAVVIAAFFLILFNVVDVATTWYVMSSYSCSDTAIVEWLIERFGLDVLMVTYLILSVVIAYFLAFGAIFFDRGRIVMFGVLLGSVLFKGYVAVNNVYILLYFIFL